MKLFSNLSSSNFSSSAQQFSNFSSSAQQFSNFSSWSHQFSNFQIKCSIFPLSKKVGFPTFQVVHTNYQKFQVGVRGFPIFQVGVFIFPIFQVKYPIICSLKKGTTGQPLMVFQFWFPIFQDFDRCAKPIFPQGPINCPLQVLERTLGSVSDWPDLPDLS